MTVDEQFWKKFLYALPLKTPEGYGESFKKTDLAESIGEGETELILDVLESIFIKLGILDTDLLFRGEWAFVSYSARLFCCSYVATLAGLGGPFFDASFWREPHNAARSDLLGRMEGNRNENGKHALPLRVNRVAWTIITRGEYVLLCPREILSQDRDRAVNGGYVLPGGRMDIKDLEGISEGEAMRFVYGIPDAPSEVSEKQLDNAFCKTLERELREELDDLRHGEDYEIEGHGDLEPYIGVYGASDRRVETETRIRLFTIRLKPSGILKLARGTGEERHGWQWVRRNDLGKEMASGRAFLAAFRSDWNCFYDPSKSEDVERAFKGNGNVQAVILPLTQEEKLTLVLRGNHKREIALPDENSVRLLLYLGWSARGFFCDEEGGNRHIGWGWVEFNDVYKDAAENLKRYLKEAEPEHDILLFCEGKCRLFQPSKEIYFSPALFEGWLSIREGENGNLQLFRKGKRLPGLCIWKETAKDFPLSESATKNLKALNDKNDVNHETLANDAHDVLNNVSPVASSQTLTEAVRSLGLRQLYASTKGKYAITIPLNTNEEAAKL